MVYGILLLWKEEKERGNNKWMPASTRAATKWGHVAATSRGADKRLERMNLLRLIHTSGTLPSLVVPPTYADHNLLFTS